MPIAYVLNIEGRVGDYLELARRISEPRSRSKPHITVRYADILAKNDLSTYEKVRVSKVEFLSAGAFGLSSSDSQKNKTVFIECEAEEIESIVHKPHFPDSVFHITLYDGTSLSFARSLFELVNSYKWNFELIFSEKLGLKKISISPKKGFKPRSLVQPVYSENIKNIYQEMFSEELTYKRLESLNDEEKLVKIKVVFDELSMITKNFKPVNKVSNLDRNYQLPIPLDDNTEREVISTTVESWSKADSNTRKKIGLYLTPPELARSVCKAALDYHESDQIKFGDPSVGTGVFFGALLDVLGGHQNIYSAKGIEIDDYRAKHTHSKWHSKGLDVVEGDYLHLNLLDKRSLIVANPPYVRFQNIKGSYASDLRARSSDILGMKVDGRSSLYVYFILLSHMWMDENCIGAWLIPSEFMETNYGVALRKYFSEKVTFLRLHRFCYTQRQFETAMVTSSVVFIKNTPPPTGHKVLFTIGNTLEAPDSEKFIPQASLNFQEKWKWETISKKMPRTAFRVSDIFEVKRGIATGANEFFILDEDSVNRFEIPSELLIPIFTRAKSIQDIRIASDDNGNPLVQRRYYVFSSDIDEDALLQKYPHLDRYFAEASKLGVRNRYLVRKRKIWYQQEFRLPAPFMCTYMGRSIDGSLPVKFIRNESKAIATNSFMLIYPSPKIFKHELQEDELESLFNDVLCKIQFDDLESQTRTYSGGLKKLEPKDLANIPVSSLPKWLTKLLRP